MRASMDWPLLARFAAISVAVGLGLYLAGGLYFEIVYYRRRRAQAADWKCQPSRFPTPRLLRSQIALGTLNMTMSSLLSALFIHHVLTFGWSRIYFDVAEHGWPWAIASTCLYFLAVDLLLYAAHRLLHHPALFRHVHRFHHRYTAPTAFASVAVHPVELLTYQLLTLLPLFILPLHAGSVIAVLLYTNYLATLDHSGVRLHSVLPWQAPTQFHDDHHVHFHVNYGQNMSLWDRLFGTYRRKGRRYGVEVFGGKGAPEGKSARDGDELWDYGDNRADRLDAVDRAAPAAERAAPIRTRRSP